MSSDPDYRSPRSLGQLSKQVTYRRLELAQPPKHPVVLLQAEPGRIFRHASPFDVSQCPCNPMKHVHELYYLSIPFHFSPRLNSSTCSFSSCFPRKTRHLTVETGTPKNAAMRLSGISSRNLSFRTSA